MIVRVLGEGQFEIDADCARRLNDLDDALQTHLESEDESAFTATLVSMLTLVRAEGRPLPDDALEPSEIILPPEDTALADVHEFMTEEGLVPDA